MKIENEIARLFGLWMKDLEDNEEYLQLSIVRAVLSAFLKWYDD